MPAAADDRQLRAMLARGLAQYRANPCDYLEGAGAGLMRMLDDGVDRSWCDDAAQQRHAAGHRTAHQRVRDSLNGTKAAMSWAMASSSTPPLPIVLTAPRDDPSTRPAERQE